MEEASEMPAWDGAPSSQDDDETGSNLGERNKRGNAELCQIGACKTSQTESSAQEQLVATLKRIKEMEEQQRLQVKTHF